ncbi:MAG: hypothetical protein PHN39_00890 [Candidatus Pacebacteria bacterium]|nr:hypothetical protein [Candidatus Paceibacterota bacterium]
MESELYTKLLILLSEISNRLGPIPFWKDFSFWLSFLNLIVLAITLFFLIRYTRATEKMEKHQFMPAVDVNMIYEKSVGKTYFWFLNASTIPAFVLIKFRVNKKKGGEIGPLRISPYHPHYPQLKKTATTFDFFKEDSSNDNIEIVLNITVTPALSKSHIKFRFIKHYRFNRSEFRWDEISWGYPDPAFPGS